MKFEHIRVMNFENALRGMRNPKESWAKSDSEFGLSVLSADNAYWTRPFESWKNKMNYSEIDEDYSGEVANLIKWLEKNGNIYSSNGLFEYAYIGPEDMKLAQTLIHAGPEHRKFMRQIFVSVDITAPLYFWKEFDTYKVGTVANSTSTMHTIKNKEITFDCFETDDFNDMKIFDIPEYGAWVKDQAEHIIKVCEELRKKYIETGDLHYWKELIRWLPEAWLQTRTVTMTYENLLAMCSKGQRRGHKLNEWSGKHHEVEECFISFARSLPYSQEFIFIDEVFQYGDKFPLVDFS